ncbi:hypothetical protein DHEL01_v210109 [Diaporthe helianthi]|uniref:Integral membrane protein n=1 Tax=Diaporthe helianthi TaxID=158607 RepID=A0A2P5HMN5_DIAHE|nr:hypothetical protein DHEL01_v210109 [Diaporthe helianthi]
MADDRDRNHEFGHDIDVDSNDSYDERTQGWVLELESIHSLGDPPSAPPSEFGGWQDEIVPAGSISTRDVRLPGAASRQHQPSQPLPGAAECLDFKKTRSGRFRPYKQSKLRNSLLGAVGFLEAANACDFAANVWNQTPVPRHVLVLMGLGGTAALGMIYFCIKDGRLSLANLRALREERRYLKNQRPLYLDKPNMLRTIDCFLDMNTRESGTEMVDRIGSDTLLGISAFMVGIGTYMAMDGNHDSANYKASNLLTGYIGNTFPAIFGVTNLLWSTYVFVRAKKQQAAALNYVKGSTRISSMLKNRTSSIQFHAALNGITGIVAGVAALITATQWWAYVLLVPCILTSGTVNIFWRKRVGYERPFVLGQISSIDEDTVFEALRYANDCHRRVLRVKASGESDAFTSLVTDPNSLMCALDVIRKNNLFEDFCLRILRDKGLSGRLFGHAVFAANSSVYGPTIDWHSLAEMRDEVLMKLLLQVAKDLLNQDAENCFKYQERHLLEVLGCYMCRGAQFGRSKKAKARKPPSQRVQTNVHTYAGRHTNDWLFGGFSLTKSLKKVFRG